MGRHFLGELPLLELLYWPQVEPCCPHLHHPGAAPILGLSGWSVQEQDIRKTWDIDALATEGKGNLLICLFP